MSKNLCSDNFELIVFGSFGFGNIGDEAVPYAIQDLIAEMGCEARIHVLSRFNNPRMKGVIGLGDQYRSKLSELNDTPAILIGGGIIEPRNMCCALRYADYFKRNQSKTTSIFMGSFEFGVKYQWPIKRRLNKIFEQLSHIYTRDFLSEIYLRDTFPEIGATTIADVVLAMQPNAERLLQDKIDNDNYIVVSLCGAWKDDRQWYRWIVRELVNLSNNLSKTLMFLPMSCHESDDDRVEHQKVIKGVIENGVKLKPIAIEELLNPRDFASIIRDATLVISMRLHGCVIAYAQETPFVGLSYHPKLYGFALTVGWRQFILPQRQPLMQSKGHYGYKFTDIGLNDNELFDSAIKALDYGHFNLLPLHKANLKAGLQEVLCN